MGTDQFATVQASVVRFSEETPDDHRNDKLSVLADRELVEAAGSFAEGRSRYSRQTECQCTYSDSTAVKVRVIDVHLNTCPFQGIITAALGDGITSATAAVIPQQLPTSLPKSGASATAANGDENAASSPAAPVRPTLCLEGLSVEHRGLWGGSISEEADLELEEDKISPVYEEPTDFATTIARLRSLLQQKSTATTPLLVRTTFQSLIHLTACTYEFQAHGGEILRDIRGEPVHELVDPVDRVSHRGGRLATIVLLHTIRRCGAAWDGFI